MNNTPKRYQDYIVFVESKSLRARSKTEYLRQVRKLATHYAGRQLGRIKEREVFDYLIHLRDVEKLRPSTLNQAVVALRMFFRDFAGLQWQLWEQFTIRRDLPLPVVLTRAETRQLLRTVRSGRFLPILTLIYHCGLRVGEAVAIKPSHIDAARGILRIVNGKALHRVRFLLGLGPCRLPPAEPSEPPRCPCCQGPLAFLASIGPVRGPPLSRLVLAL